MRSEREGLPGEGHKKHLNLISLKKSTSSGNNEKVAGRLTKLDIKINTNGSAQLISVLTTERRSLRDREKKEVVMVEKGEGG
jgi:hypothetical protein